MNYKQIAAHRLYNQRVADLLCDTPEEAVLHMGAIQAQDYKQALWAVGSRMNDATLDEVEAALADGRIVRTWPMRGTIHFVPAADVCWMLDLCASRVVAKHTRRMTQLELTHETMATCASIFKDVLGGGNRLTRAQLLQVVADAGISTEGQRGYHILYHTAQTGVICMGPMMDNQQTFVLLDEWVTSSTSLTRDEALKELVLRYFRSHGPATEADFARWGGLTLTDTRHGLEMNSQTLTSTEVGDVVYWHVQTDEVATQTGGVRLLAGYDEYVIGYQDRSAVLADEHAGKIVPGNNGVFQPIIVIDGQVVGTWKRKFKRRTLDITLYPFESITDHMQEVQAAAEAYSAFMGLSLAKLVTA